MRLLLFLRPSILALLCALLLAPMAFAQEAQRVVRLEIALWPEYDRSAVLVIYRAELPPDTSLPATVQLPIPAGVGEPHAVASSGPSGELLNAPFTRRVEGEWATIAIETNSRIVWLEFYQDLTRQDDRRSFTFVWPGGVEVESVAYELQQPFDASNVEAVPSPESQRLGEDGLLYFQRELGPAEATGELTIQISYSKPTAGLSADFLQPVSPLGRPETTQGDTTDFSQALPLIAGGALAVLVGLGGLYYFRLRPRPAPARRRRRPARKAELDPATTYCHNCGTAADLSDRFCRNCGERLRR